MHLPFSSSFIQGVVPSQGMECEHFLYNLASIKEECETFYAEAITPSDVGSFIRSMGMTANIGYQHIRSFIVEPTF